MKVCAEPGCPTITSQPRCPTHARTHEQHRGTAAQRGYNSPHQRLRTQWAARIATGTIHCSRCGDPIHPNEPWDLGHDDHDRTHYRGPEHAARCNRSAAGRKSHRSTP